LNYLDIIIAIILLLFGFKGFRKGLIIEVVTLVAFVVGIYGAMHFSDFTAEHMQEVMEIDPKFLNTVAFVLTFILLVILVNVIGHLLTKALKAMNLHLWNKLGGAVFGLLKGLLLCSTFVLVINNLQWFGIIKEEVRKESLLYPYVEKTVPYLYKGFDLVKGYAKEIIPEEPEEKEKTEPLSPVVVETRFIASPNLYLDLKSHPVPVRS